MARSAANSTLFPQDARRRFLEITGQRYDNMRKRVEKKHLPPLTFTKDGFREQILRQLDGRHDGGISCRYCHRTVDIADCAMDHALPLSRGGSPDLSNIEAICGDCNAVKGEMTPQEMVAFLLFLERALPLARVGILSRLQAHSKLLANTRRNAVRLREMTGGRAKRLSDQQKLAVNEF